MDQIFIKPVEIKPAVFDWLRQSELLSAKANGLSPEDVHDIRVFMKKARAVLKIAACQLIPAENERDLAALRAVSGSLRSPRNLTILRKTLRSLKKEHSSLFLRLADNERIALLLERKEAADECHDDTCELAAVIREILRKTRSRLCFRSMGKIDPRQLFSSLEETYAELAALYLSCRNRPRPGRLHRFRKRAKDLLYQLALFRTFSPGRIGTLEKQLGRLTRNLGKVHDLEELRLALLDVAGELSADKNLSELVLLIRDRQDKYLSEIWPVAFRLFRPGKRLESLLGKGVQCLFMPQLPGPGN